MAASKVKVVSIISIVLGVLGLVGVLSGAVSFFIGPQTPMRPVAGMTPQQVEVSQAMGQAFLDLHNTWRIYTGIDLVLSLVLAAALIAGGIMGLKFHASGRDILATTFGVAMPLKIVQAVTAAWIGISTMQIINEFMLKMMRPTNAPAGPIATKVEGIASGVMQASAIVGIAVGVGWALLQLGFYIVGLVYLRKPEVRAVFRA